MTIAIKSKIKSFEVVDQNAKAINTNFTNEADRRLKLDNVEGVANTMRWEHRPRLAEGNPSQTFHVEGPDHKFFVVVGYVRNGSPDTGYVFEVLVAGNPPRALNALAKSISMDARSRDRGWLKAKLEAIAKVEGTAFDMAMPDGTLVRMPSEVAAFARLVLWQCEKLGTFTEANLAKDTSLMDALMSNRRPKTTPDGGIAWYCDVHNPNTGDKFKVFVPELDLGNGRKRPYEVWFDGVFPLQSFRGLAKSLSLDLQIRDIDWAVRKLHQLRTLQEVQGDFWAPIPGQEKSRVYPSTVAYVAELILHRFKVLGLVNDRYEVGNSTVVAFKGHDQEAGHQAPKLGMKDCAECGAKGSVKVDGGCATCMSCSYSSCS